MSQLYQSGGGGNANTNQKEIFIKSILIKRYPDLVLCIDNGTGSVTKVLGEVLLQYFFNRKRKRKVW